MDRLFDIIETLSSNSHGISLTELSETVGLHVSTTHRLLAALVDRGYAQKDIETGKYRLTMRLFEVGSRIVNGMNLVSISRPHLEHLADITGETVHLVARYGDEVVYLYKEDTTNSIVRMASFVGQKTPMYCTGVGKSILAYLPEKEVRGIWSRTEVTAFTPNTITDFDQLEKCLVSVHESGYAIDDEEHELGVRCVAAPIFDFRSAPVAALSISFPASRIDEERMTEFARNVVSASRSITNLIGGHSN